MQKNIANQSAELWGQDPTDTYDMQHNSYTKVPGIIVEDGAVSRETGSLL